MLNVQELLHRAQRRVDFSNTLTVTINQAYTTGFTLGGAFSIDNANGVHGPNEEPTLSAILQSLSLFDPTGQSAAIDLLFFNQPLVGTYKDFAAFVGNSTDMQNCIGVTQIVNGDYISLGSGGGTLAGTAKEANIGRVLKPAGVSVSSKINTAIYCVPVVRGTPTYTNASLYLKLQFSQGL